jgi:hypothetical protein
LNRPEKSAVHGATQQGVAAALRGRCWSQLQVESWLLLLLLLQATRTCGCNCGDLQTRQHQTQQQQQQFKTDIPYMDYSYACVEQDEPAAMQHVVHAAQHSATP